MNPSTEKIEPVLELITVRAFRMLTDLSVCNNQFMIHRCQNVFSND